MRKAMVMALPSAERCASVSKNKMGLWLEIRHGHFQAHWLRIVRKAEPKQNKTETEGYPRNVGIASNHAYRVG
jgi:hypothetical protein